MPASHEKSLKVPVYGLEDSGYAQARYMAIIRAPTTAC
jgi:hypothetical protein